MHGIQKIAAQLKCCPLGSVCTCALKGKAIYICSTMTRAMYAMSFSLFDEVAQFRYHRDFMHDGVCNSEVVDSTPIRPIYPHICVQPPTSRPNKCDISAAAH